MNTDEMAMVLGLFESAWPQRFEIADYTAHVWAEATSDVAGDVGLDAARRLVLTLEWPPTIARFRDECAEVVLGRYPQPDPEPEPTSAGSQWAAIARGLREASSMIPKHDHRQGWQRCPACSTQEQREPALLEALRREMDVPPESAVEPSTAKRRPRAGSFYDPDCTTCDHGWAMVAPAFAASQVEGGRDLPAVFVELQARLEAREQFGTDDDTLDHDLLVYAEKRRQVLMWSTAVYPCPECRRTEYDRWRAGCYRPNHYRKSCKVCGPDAVKRLDADEPTTSRERTPTADL